MKKILFFLLFVSVPFSLWAKQLSPTAYFSILTCAPGTQIHAHFGHSAIRLCDTANNVDIVFNYGIFSYTDDFAYNFVKGETYYRLGIQQFSSFISEYYMDSRGVIEQQLRLSPYQKQYLFDLLQTNYLPQNRTYLYNFFYDNCSSRPRDLLIKVLGDSLVWHKPTQCIYDSLWLHTTEQYLVQEIMPSWRTFIHAYVGEESWLRFGISLGLGIPADSKPTIEQTMFLPDCLFLMAQYATVKQEQSHVNLVNKTQVLVPQEVAKTQASYFSVPSHILWLICIIFIGIAGIEFWLQKHVYLVDSIVFFMFGLIGIFVWYVSFISIHPAVYPNIHVVWASPILLLFAIVWLFSSLRTYTVYYLYIHIVLLLLFCLVALFQKQYIHSGYVALVIIQLSRIPFVLLQHKNGSI
ncbi:MAG TPA: DUF4105 domain-containing protein [Bacteroidales bacterium]|nr:DUF4105 domain-containing protein [Bacteroidales bacterium]